MEDTEGKMHMRARTTVAMEKMPKLVLSDCVTVPVRNEMICKNELFTWAQPGRRMHAAWMKVKASNPALTKTPG